MTDQVYYNKVSGTVFFGCLKDAILGSDENKSRVRIIAKEFFEKLQSTELYNKLKETSEEDFPEIEKRQLTNFLEKFMDKQISQIINMEKQGEEIVSVEYSSKRLLLLSRFFIIISDYRLAAECIWAVVAIELKAFAKDKCEIDLETHNSLRRFCSTIRSWLQVPELIEYFNWASIAHKDGFYENNLSVSDLRTAMQSAKKFVSLLNQINLTEEQKQRLRGRTF